MTKQLWLIGVLLMTSVVTKHIEICCTFADTLQKDIAVLSSMFSSVDLKLIMGCTVKPASKCGCFENTWGCQKIAVTELDSRRRFDIDNGKPAHVFDQIMRELNAARAPLDKDSLHLYFCPDSNSTPSTPFVWSLLRNHTWSYKKWCFSPDNKYEIRVSSNLLLGIPKFTKPLRHLVNSLPSLQMDLTENDFAEYYLGVTLTTTSNLAFTKISNLIKPLFKDAVISYKPYIKSEEFQLHKEELIMEFEFFKCRTFDYKSCLGLLNAYYKIDTTNTLYHLSSELLDLFMTTAVTPAVLVTYDPSLFEETQELCVLVDSSLGQSTITDYTVAMMAETKERKSGIYFMIYPNSLKKCDEEVMQCLSKNLKVYLPPSTASLDGDVGVVFGEQHLDSEDSHRGNLNNRWFFEPPEDIKELKDIKTMLHSAEYEPLLKSETTSLAILDSKGYDRVLADKTGHFILFVFRSDVGSLHTLKQLLLTNITGISVVECFSLNLICEALDIKVYPAVYFVRDSNILHYSGSIEESALNTFRALTQHPVVTASHRIQIDLILKDGENKAAVLISSSKSRDVEATFHLACNEMYGFIRCYFLHSNTVKDDDVVVVHVPDDPVMINKRYPVTKNTNLTSMIAILKKLSIPSVISESGLLLVYKDLTEIVLFDEILDDKLAAVVNYFPFVQFVQVSSPDFKHKLLNELIGYNYESSILFISKIRNCGYKLHEEATLETWIQAAIDEKLSPDFRLKDLEESKYKYHDIYYKNQFKLFRDNVRYMKADK